MSVNQAKKYIKENAKYYTDQDIRNFANMIENDGRSGIIEAFNSVLKNREAIQAEKDRVKALYDFQDTIAALPGSIILGLDEVGRGPLAGPLTVGGVVLKRDSLILGLNDSKKITAKKRVKIAEEIKNNSVIWKTFSVPPSYIDKLGMTQCLKKAFKNIVEQVESEKIKPDVILLDGNPLSFDAREVNVIKGDAKCASISAASIIAKVDRDSYMENINDKYPQYNFKQNKGYGTAQHIEAIKEHGLSPIHRKTFCTAFMQMSLF